MRKKRYGKHLLAAGLTTMLITTGLAVSAQGEDLTTSAAASRFLSGTIADTDLGQVAELEGASAANPGETGPVTNPLKLSVLQAIRLGEPIDLDLAGFLSPGNGSAGVANHFAAAPSRSSADAASGAVNDSGAILTTDPSTFPSNAKISLRGGLLDGVDQLSGFDIGVGALSGSSRVADGTVTRDYQIAGLDLGLQVPAVAAVLDGLSTQLDQVDADDITLDTASICRATGGALDVSVDALLSQLSTLGIDTTVLRTLLPGTGSVDLCDLPLGVGAILTEPVLAQLVQVRITGLQSVLDGVGTLTADGVSIDLAAGTISLDLEQVLEAAGKNLNDLPPNTDILAFVLSDVDDTITSLLDSLSADLVSRLGDLSVGVTVAGTEVIPSATTQQITQLGLEDALSQLIDSASTGLQGVLDPVQDVIDQLLPTIDQVVRLVGNNQSSSTSPTVTTSGPSGASGSSAARATADPASTGRYYRESALKIDLLGGDLASIDLAAAEVGVLADQATTTAGDDGTPPPTTTTGGDDGTTPPPTTTTGSDDGGVTQTLPNTGAPNILPFFVLGLILVAAGLATIVAERRRDALLTSI